MNNFDFTIEIELDTHVHIQQRVRYNVWDLLGDVGGFNDGLILLCSIFMSSYSAFSYRMNVLNQIPVDLES